jgi:hypothetical protein
VTFASFVHHLYTNNDGEIIIQQLDMVCTALDLFPLEKEMLRGLKLQFAYNSVLIRMFEIWIPKEEAKNGAVTLKKFSDIMKSIEIELLSSTKDFYDIRVRPSVCLGRR